MKPDFSQMSRKELKDYVLSHRDDLDALHALYERRSPDSEAKWYKPPTTLEEIEQQFEEFKREIEKREGKRDEQ
ncbi:hypothetical protein LEP3755_10550 [Leptolyngbya sp. NIES-3755]|nr:hypothetical protein LEP3755_10550 [Leptolyngbya sp. NIES-3755]